MPRGSQLGAATSTALTYPVRTSLGTCPFNQHSPVCPGWLCWLHPSRLRSSCLAMLCFENGQRPCGLVVSVPLSEQKCSITITGGKLQHHTCFAAACCDILALTDMK